MRLAPLLIVISTAAFAADRVKEVRERRGPDVKSLVEKAGLTYPVDEVYLRAFKKEKKLELWASKRGQPMTLVKIYDFCSASGELGPKRREGDLQVPEGLYEVPSFNPTSNYHLSMKVSYPNASDKVRSDAKRPGGLIYLHGDCVSIGCIAIEDEPIEEVYLISLDAKVRPIRFDIFPARLDDVEKVGDAEHLEFWKELTPAYTSFEKTKRPARFSVNPKTGAYSVK
ncbi:MAG: L,D-transpeptidase family protein [Archangium sp.]